LIACFDSISFEENQNNKKVEEIATVISGLYFPATYKTTSGSRLS
jgi:hypothetical protein